MINDTLLVSAADKEANMNEIFFIVEDAPEGGYMAKALGESIYTDADIEPGINIATQSLEKACYRSYIRASSLLS